MTGRTMAGHRARGRLYALGVIGAALALALTACGSGSGGGGSSRSSGDNGALPQVSILSFNTGLGQVLSVAMEKNHFDTKNGFQAEFVRVDSDAATQAFLQGEADVTLQLGFLEAAIARNKGQKITIFFPDLTNNGTITVAKESDITTPEDLKGKKIGQFGLGSGATTAMRYIFSKNYGIDLTKDMSLVKAGPPALVHLLASGQVDAMIDFTPYTEQAMVENGARQVMRAGDPANGYIPGFGAVAAHESWIKENPDLAYNVRAAVKDTIQFFVSQKYAPLKDETYSKLLGVDSKVVDRVVSRANKEPLMNDEWSEATVTKARQFFSEVAANGVLLKKAPDPEVVTTLEDLVGPRK